MPKTILVTIGAAATQISATNAPFNQMIVQANGSNVVYLGDSSVTTSNGIELTSGTPGSSVVIGPLSTSAVSQDASYYYLRGTQNDTVRVLLI